jgi:hypothetical protein
MSRSTLPTVQIEADVLRDAISVLGENESVSDFVSQCVRGGITWRRTQDAFVARARASIERGIREGRGITPHELLKRMDDRIKAASLGKAADEEDDGVR